jgi:transposase
MSQPTILEVWTRQLDLEGYQVVSERRDRPSDPVRLVLAPTATVALCPHCSRPTDAIHRKSDSDLIRDLPHGPQAVELVIRTPQYRCDHCGGFFTPTCPHVAPGAHATERFLEQAARLIRFADIANAAAFLGVPEKTLSRWYYDHVQRQQDKPVGEAPKPIKSLGIDELSLKKSTGSS